MRSLILFTFACWLRHPKLRRIQNKLLAASWNAQRRSGRGPWEII